MENDIPTSYEHVSYVSVQGEILLANRDGIENARFVVKKNKSEYMLTQSNFYGLLIVSPLFI